MGRCLWGGVSIFHECGTNGWTTPVNPYGGEYPRTGQSYMGFLMWTLSPQYEGQFGGVELISPLIAGKKYRVEFYVSVMDSVCYAIKNVGIYFSQSQPPANINTLLSYEPQVRYTGDDYLSDKEGWMKIEGSFYAEGGEQFITIGNFDGHFGADTLLLLSCGIPPPGMGPTYWMTANYFIDDVSVELDTLTSVGEYEKIKFSVYPNPARDFVTVETPEIKSKTTLQIVDLTGRVILVTAITADNIKINLSGIPSGVYTAAVLHNCMAVARRIIVIE